MLILGIILALIGWLVGISPLVTIGIILVVVGAVLMVLDVSGRPLGGRRWY